MPHAALVTFTGRPLGRILHDGGSRDWRLDADRARRCEFLICTQNRHNPEFTDDEFGPPAAPHGHAFLIGRIADVVPSAEVPDRWLIKFSEYIVQDIPNIWGKSGHLRYPVWYTTLEALGIDLAALPPFQPWTPPGDTYHLAEAMGAFVAPPRNRPPPHQGTPRAGVQTPPVAVHSRVASADTANADAWERLDAILAQLDRVPDLPAPVNPLDWDEHGVPR